MREERDRECRSCKFNKIAPGARSQMPRVFSWLFGWRRDPFDHGHWQCPDCVRRDKQKRKAYVSEEKARYGKDWEKAHLRALSRGIDLRPQAERDAENAAGTPLRGDDEMLAHRLCQLATESTTIGDRADIEMK